jgi:hypothetical protein
MGNDVLKLFVVLIIFFFASAVIDKRIDLSRLSVLQKFILGFSKGISFMLLIAIVTAMFGELKFNKLYEVILLTLGISCFYGLYQAVDKKDLF